jgi:hypothetical protein
MGYSCVLPTKSCCSSSAAAGSESNRLDKKKKEEEDEPMRATDEKKRGPIMTTCHLKLLFLMLAPAFFSSFLPTSSSRISTYPFLS